MNEKLLIVLSHFWKFVDSGQTVRVTKLAKSVGVSARWLQQCSTRGQRTVHKSSGRPRYLSEEDEDRLVELLFAMADADLPVSIVPFMALVQDLHLETTGIDSPPSDSWFRLQFLKRRPDITLGLGKTISIHRMLSASLPSVIMSIQALKLAIEMHGITADNIFMADETDTTFELSMDTKVSKFWFGCVRSAI